MDRLGWHWWPGPQSIASRAHGNLRACGLRGTCLTGCPDRAKATTDLTHWPEALERGVRLVTGARVNRITTDARGRASGATYIDRAGREHHQAADVVIVCANGVGTPRLLQLSGLANSSGLVGKRLMMHPYAAVVGFYDEPLESWLGPTGQTIQSMQFYETDESRGFVRGGKWQVMSTGGPLGLRAAYGGAPLEERFGESLHRNLREQLGRGLEWGVIAEDLPEDSNYVALDAELTDSDGVAAPRIVYRNSDNTRALLDFHLERLHEAHAAAGALKTVATPLMRDCGWHLLGTCKMGDDPATSVVDADGRAHDVPNLYVVRRQRLPDVGGRQPDRDDRGGQPALHGAPDRDGTSPGGAGVNALDRERLGALADLLVPAAAGMPSATEAGVHREGLDRVLAARPDLEPLLLRVLASADGDPGDVLLRLQASDEPGFAALTLAVTGAYYTDPEVRRLIGYPGQQYQPELVTRAPDWDEAALARVVARGAIYRSTGT